MKVLTINSGKSYFKVGSRDVEPQDISREDLLKILNDIYEAEEEISIPDTEFLNDIRNPVEKEIVQQIIQKISDFADNIDNIRDEVKGNFPEIPKSWEIFWKMFKPLNKGNYFCKTFVKNIKFNQILINLENKKTFISIF